MVPAIMRNSSSEEKIPFLGRYLLNYSCVSYAQLWTVLWIT